jgi:hypothetical protein
MPAGLPDAADAATILDLIDLADDPGAAVERLRGSATLTRADVVLAVCPTADHTTRRAITAVLEALGVGPSLTRDDVLSLGRTLDFALSLKAVTITRIPPPPSRLAVTATTAPELTELRQQLRLPPLVQLVEDVIRTATEVCVLGAPYWNISALERLSPALSGLARRGGCAEFICQGGPPNEFDPLPALRRLSADLRAAGGSTQIWTFSARDDAGRWAQLHAKFALADRGYGYLGSANMTGQGFGHHFEIGVRLSSAEAGDLADLLSRLKLGGFLLPA